MGSTKSALFSCPRCMGQLQVTARELTCAPCGASYPIRDGILDFRCRRHDYYFNPVPRNEMAAIVRHAPAIPWDDTVRRFLRFVRSVPEWIDNIAVNGRYSWKLFLELPPGSRFLDFGCGLGNLTQNLASHVGEVVALDLTWERLLFAQQRFAKFNPDARITLVAGGDGAHLPFPDAHFDCIALSGVLEWIATDPSLHGDAQSRASKGLRMLMTFFGETNPRKTQLRFLKELGRILKPDGQLFVAIENRWSYSYFKGCPEHHSGLKYGSLLPRFIANLYSIAYRRRPYRTYTYSFHEFRRLFAAAGFPYQECFGLSPGYSGLDEIFFSHTTQTFLRPRRADTLKARIKNSRYFVPAFGMAAFRTAEQSRPLIGRVLDEIQQNLPALGDVDLHTCLVTSKDKVVFKGSASGTAIILKIPAGSRAEAGEANNLHILEMLAGRPAIGNLLPKPLVHGVHQGLSYFLERAVLGQPLGSALDIMTRASAAERVTEILLRMHTPANALIPLSEGTGAYAYLITVPVAKLRTAGLDPARCDRLEHRLGAALTAHQWSLGLCHGDFSKNNIFVSAGDLSGVIDWEYATTQGLPVLDAISYMESMQRLIDRRADRHSGMTENMVRLARWDWPSVEEVELLKGLYRHFQVDVRMHGVLCEVCRLHHMSRQVETAVRFDPQFIDKKIRPMFSALTAGNVADQRRVAESPGVTRHAAR